MNRNSALVIVALAITALSVVGASLFLDPSHPVPAPPEPITISIPPIDASALYYIAEDRHFFAENGLNVNVRYFDPAAAAIPAMLDGEVDVAGKPGQPVHRRGPGDKGRWVVPAERL